MTRILENTTQQKAPTMDSKGLIAKLLEYKPVTRQELANNAVLTKLYDLEHGLNQVLNLDNTMLDIDDDISIGGELLPTAKSIGLVLQNNQQQPVSLACVTSNGNDAPLITDTSQPCAFIIGNISQNSQIWAVDNLNDGIELYHYLNVINGQPVTVIVNLIKWAFMPMVKHFSEIQTVYVATTIDDKNKFELLAGANVKTVTTTFDLLLELEQGKTYNEIIADATITDMQVKA